MKLTPRVVAEGALGTIQIVAQLIGSTTLAGACIYEALSISWWIWMISGRMWGFLPLNIGGIIVSTIVLWRTIHE